MMSHRLQVKEHLERGQSITTMQALAFYQCMNLPARIQELRKEGMQITTTKIKTGRGTYVAKYTLEKNNADIPTI